MQPAPSERARFLHIVVSGLLVFGVGLGSLGCSDGSTGTNTYSPFGPVDTIAATEAPRDSVLALLDGMHRSAFDSSFAHLDEMAVTRHVRTEQLDTTGATTAYRTLTLRYEPGRQTGTVRRADSAGSFRDGGILSSITPAERRASKTANLAEQALPDQPAYLAPRTQEAYRYALRRDSLLDGTPTYVVEAKARTTGRGPEQDIRYARLTIDRASNELVGLTATRASRILLFRENSLLTFRLYRPSVSTQTWVPRLTRFRALVDVPFRPARQYRTVSTYYGYAPR